MPSPSSRTQFSAGVSLRRLLPDAEFWGEEDIVTTACCGDAHQCQPGDLFVAMVGPDGDGHDQVQHALRRGAGAVVAERLLPLEVPVCIARDSREAFAAICRDLADRPDEKLDVIGVTGTNGKTTCTRLISAVLRAARPPSEVGSVDCLGVYDGGHWTDSLGPQPSPAALAELFARSAANGCRQTVVELSSTALAQRRAAGISFRGAVLTNLRRDHLDFHGSVANYHRSKQQLLEQVSPAGFVVVNGDDAACRGAADRLSRPVVTFGQHTAADVTATLLERHVSEQTFLLRAGSHAVAVCTKLIGDHHISNCLAAAAVGLVSGLDLAVIAKGLESVDHLPYRFERIECGQPFSVFVDSSTTPDRLAVCLKTLRKTTPGRVLCVFAADTEQETQTRPLLGRVVERHADVSVITSSRGKEDVLPIAHDILDGYEHPARARLSPDRSSAIAWALSMARPGDSLLVAGGRGVGSSGNDDELVRQQLYSSAPRRLRVCGAAA